jgi:hypothetical protein
MFLLFAGVAIQRRIFLSADETEVSDLQTTLTLLFALQILCDEKSAYAEPPLDLEAEPTVDALQQWQMTPLAAVLCNDDEDAGLLPDVVCRACCAKGRREATLAALSALATTYFRCSSLALAYNLLGDCGGQSSDFLTLDAMDVLNEANLDARLMTVVEAAETEAGQQVIRDLILSFTLPPMVVGVRRSLLLSRAATREATAKYAEQLQNAHEAAMRGALWSWNEDESMLHKMCALLAGAALLTTPGAGLDAVRKGDAFGGRVELPFLATEAPPAGTRRLALVPHSNEWVVFCSKGSQTLVKLKDEGFRGLCRAVLLLGNC